MTMYRYAMILLLTIFLNPALIFSKAPAIAIIHVEGRCSNDTNRKSFSAFGEDIEIEIINVQHVSCNGGSNGSALAVVTGGIPPYIYNWSNGQSSALLSNVPAGTYILTVTDNIGDTGTASVIITQPSALTLNITVQEEITCNNPLAQLTVQAAGGTSPYMYLWSTGVPGSTIFVDAGGNYTVTVTDANQCTNSLTLTVTENIDAPSISAGPDLTIECAGGSIQLLGSGPSGGQYNILWTTTNGNIVSGQNTYNPTVNQIGDYVLRVTNVLNGCFSEDIASITNIAPPINLNIVSENISCFGASDGTATANASGGTGTLSFLWSNNSTSSMITGLAPGTYTVTVSDVNACSTSSSVIITQPTQLTLSLNITSETGPGLNDGTVAANPSGGSPAYTYLWNTGDTTQSLAGLEPGVYTVTVTDQNGCTVTASGEVLPYECLLELDLLSFQFVTCFGGSDGSALVQASGGQSPYTYIWSNGQSGQNLINAPAGTYTVTATDQAGCSTTINVLILQPDAIVIQLQVQQMSGEGANDGMISATLSGGTGNLTYLWSNGQNGNSISNLAPGTYTLTVTDANNCTATATGVINDINCTISTEIVLIQPISCNGNNNGAINLIVTGQSGSITVSWNDGSNELSRQNLGPGMYSVTVTDEDNCVSTSSIILINPPLLLLSQVVENETVPGAMDGSITLFISGGTAPYNIQWSNGSTQNPLENLSEGVYQVTVTDNNGCTAFAQITVNSGDCALNATFALNHVTCYGLSDGSITVEISGGIEPYLYLWSNESVENSITNLSPGIYTVTINDQSECDLILSFEVSQPDSFLLDTLNFTPVIQSEGRGIIELLIYGSVPPYTFVWYKDGMFFSNQLSIFNLDAGMYELEIVDSNGCLFSRIFEIELETSVINQNNNTHNYILSPNPARDQIQITSDKISANFRLNIYTLQGSLIKTVYSESANQISVFNIEYLNSGIYILELTEGHSTSYLKLIKAQ